MKKSTLILLVLIAILLIPTSSKKFIIAAKEDFSTYIGYAGITNADIKEVVEEVNPQVACSCGGTKKVKSGDGLISMPCPCGANCTCKAEQKLGCQCGCGKMECQCGKSAGACATSAVAAENEKPIFYTYYFTAPRWCAPCRRFHDNELPKLKEWKVAKKWEKGVNVVISDIDEEPKLFSDTMDKINKLKNKKFDPMIPCFVVMKNNEPVEIHQGFMTFLQFAKFHNETIEGNR